MNDFNPYQPPKSILYPDHDKIQVEMGGVVFVPIGQTLPKRCIKCNVETLISHRQTYTWHSAWWYLLLPFYLIYFMLYLFIRKKCRLAVGLCVDHHRQRQKILWLSFFLLMVMLIIIYQAFLRNFPLIGLINSLALFVMIIWSNHKTQLIKVVRIDNTGIWFKGCGQDFLQSLKQENQRMK